jgi:hypothetical protein
MDQVLDVALFPPKARPPRPRRTRKGKSKEDKVIPNEPGIDQPGNDSLRAHSPGAPI